MRKLEGKMSSLAHKITLLAHERGNCDAIELRN